MFAAVLFLHVASIADNNQLHLFAAAGFKFNKK
jgi:hypothetical protein